MLLPEADCDYLENDDWELKAKLARLEAENTCLREEVDRLSRQLRALSEWDQHVPNNPCRSRGELEHESIED